MATNTSIEIEARGMHWITSKVGYGDPDGTISILVHKSDGTYESVTIRASADKVEISHFVKPYVPLGASFD